MTATVTATATAVARTEVRRVVCSNGGGERGVECVCVCCCMLAPCVRAWCVLRLSAWTWRRWIGAAAVTPPAVGGGAGADATRRTEAMHGCVPRMGRVGEVRAGWLVAGARGAVRCDAAVAVWLLMQIRPTDSSQSVRLLSAASGGGGSGAEGAHNKGSRRRRRRSRATTPAAHQRTARTAGRRSSASFFLFSFLFRSDSRPDPIQRASTPSQMRNWKKEKQA